MMRYLDLCRTRTLPLEKVGSRGRLSLVGCWKSQLPRQNVRRCPFLPTANCTHKLTRCICQQPAASLRYTSNRREGKWKRRSSASSETAVGRAVDNTSSESTNSGKRGPDPVRQAVLQVARFRLPSVHLDLSIGFHWPSVRRLYGPGSLQELAGVSRRGGWEHNRLCNGLLTLQLVEGCLAHLTTIYCSHLCWMVAH